MANEQNLKPFKPGQSGNPAGLPKGTRHVSKWIDELLHDEEFTTTIRQGMEIKEYKGAPIKAIVGAQIRMAVNGDVKASDLLFKYGYGTKQTIEHEGSLVLGTPDPDKAKKFAEFLKDDTKDS